jgi:hypothetical protein
MRFSEWCKLSKLSKESKNGIIIMHIYMHVKDINLAIKWHIEIDEIKLWKL